MKTSMLSLAQEKTLSKAVQVLDHDGLIVFPTDTVYGLASALRNDAIKKIYKVKARDPQKPIAVLVGSLDQVDLVAEHFPGSAKKLAQTFWPGALTLVVQKSDSLPEALTPDQTIGIRLPDHNFLRELLLNYGPLATTSANLSGAPSAVDAQEAYEQLNGKVDLIIDGGKTSGGVASTVLDCTEEKIRILRLGAITESELFRIDNISFRS